MRFSVVLVLMLAACGPEPARESVRWQPIELRLTAADNHPWWSFPVRSTWTHEQSGRTLEIDAVWDGGRAWLIRFAAPEAGTWRYETSSDDAGLDGLSGLVEAAEPGAEAVETNPNLRGQVRASADGRHFEYADGTPFLLLADTLWAGNTARAGLGSNEGGPFFEYLDDRQDNGFTAVLMQTVHGFGDYPEDPAGHANEGGHLFVGRDFEQLNPDYLEYADRRWEVLFERGLAVASPFLWWGKTESCVFEPEQAQKLAGYLAARYGAFNVIWAVSGNSCMSSKYNLPPMAEMRCGNTQGSSPCALHAAFKAAKAMSSRWTPSLPRSPVP